MVVECIKEAGIKLLEWPFQNPDLNIIKNMWHSAVTTTAIMIILKSNKNNRNKIIIIVRILLVLRIIIVQKYKGSIFIIQK